MADWAAEKANEIMAKWYGTDPDEPGEGPTNAMLLSYLAQALRDARAEGMEEVAKRLQKPVDVMLDLTERKFMDKISCPRCHKTWPTPCEQSVAISKRGMCIPCLFETNPSVDWLKSDPYEFAYPGHPHWKPVATFHDEEDVSGK